MDGLQVSDAGVACQEALDIGLRSGKVLDSRIRGIKIRDSCLLRYKTLNFRICSHELSDASFRRFKP